MSPYYRTKQHVAPVQCAQQGDGNRHVTRGRTSEYLLPKPVPLASVSVATDGVVLISQPHNEDDVECSGGVIEELRHDGLHACGRQRTPPSASRHRIIPAGLSPALRGYLEQTT